MHEISPEAEESLLDATKDLIYTRANSSNKCVRGGEKKMRQNLRHADWVSERNDEAHGQSGALSVSHSRPSVSPRLSQCSHLWSKQIEKGGSME